MVCAKLTEQCCFLSADILFLMPREAYGFFMSASARVSTPALLYYSAGFSTECGGIVTLD